jgi:hypothetical protein
MDKFLNSQFDQLDLIVNSFKEDITTLDDIVRSWEELPNSKSEELSEIIKSKIKNKTAIEVFIDEQGQYLLNIKFEPISIVWTLKVDYNKSP